MDDREFDMQVGRKVAAIRQGKGWTQSELVQRMHGLRPQAWHQQTVTKVESGGRPLKFREAVDLAAALEVDVEELFGPDESTEIVYLVEGLVRTAEGRLREALTVLQDVGGRLREVEAYAQEIGGLPTATEAKVAALISRDIPKEAGQAVAEGAKAWRFSPGQ